jgi:hypothetical protein
MNVTTSVERRAGEIERPRRRSRGTGAFPAAAALIFANLIAPRRTAAVSVASASLFAVARVAFVREHESPGARQAM